MKTRKARDKRNSRKTKRVRFKNSYKKGKTKGGLKKENCSPKPNNELNSFSCYTDDSLYKLRDKWNMRHPKDKIISNDPKIIHHRLKSYLYSVCKKESCWIKQENHFGDVKEEVHSFAPKSPNSWKQNPNEWLSSVEINKVMKQYEKAYKCFEFIGPTPIDFDKRKLYGECVWDELCNFSLEQQIKSGKTKIGIIFNTDPHNMPGQHWISMFINIKRKQIFFFDSTGDKAPKEILELVKKLKKQGLSLHPPIKFKFDSSQGIEHQEGNTECGIYSLYFIVHMLEDKFTTEYIKTHLIKDKYVNKFRKIYFNEDL